MSAEAAIDPEDRQAMEQMLRRVEDDPAGLLRSGMSKEAFIATGVAVAVLVPLAFVQVLVVILTGVE